MARQWGAKDKTKRVRRTKKQIAEDRKQQVSEHIRKIREEEQERISKKYYLLPRELLEMSGISYGELVCSLKANIMERLENLINE